jgi:hypothetical protein
MAYSDLLIDTCTTTRFVDGAVDAYGVPAKTWVNQLVDTPCRWSYPSHRETKNGAEVVTIDLTLFLGDVDVTEQDRVVHETVTYEVFSAIDRQDGVGEHHKECLMRRVR